MRATFDAVARQKRGCNRTKVKAQQVHFTRFGILAVCHLRVWITRIIHCNATERSPLSNARDPQPLSIQPTDKEYLLQMVGKHSLPDVGKAMRIVLDFAHEDLGADAEETLFGR